MVGAAREAKNIFLFFLLFLFFQLIYGEHDICAAIHHHYCDLTFWFLSASVKISSLTLWCLIFTLHYSPLYQNKLLNASSFLSLSSLFLRISIVLSAKGILTKGKNGTNNCFTTIALGKEKFATSIKDKATQNVDWREECELYVNFFFLFFPFHSFIRWCFTLTP